MSETRVDFNPNPEMMAGNCGSSEPFALQVLDDSMEPEFKRGCIIVIDPSGVVEHECYVMAEVENGFIFRQLSIEGERIYIQPLNPAYMHEKKQVKQEQLVGRIIQQASPKGKRSERKHYV